MKVGASDRARGKICTSFLRLLYPSYLNHFLISFDWICYEFMLLSNFFRKVMIDFLWVTENVFFFWLIIVLIWLEKFDFCLRFNQYERCESFMLWLFLYNNIGKIWASMTFIRDSNGNVLHILILILHGRTILGIWLPKLLEHTE